MTWVPLLCLLPVDVASDETCSNDILRWVEGKVKDGALVGEGIGLQVGLECRQQRKGRQSVSERCLWPRFPVKPL
jgi:hypothetical protein